MESFFLFFPLPFILGLLPLNLYPYTLYLKLKCNNLPRKIYFISLSIVIQQIIQRGEPRSKYNLALDIFLLLPEMSDC